jgi:hypothetical protein
MPVSKQRIQERIARKAIKSKILGTGGITK